MLVLLLFGAIPRCCLRLLLLLPAACCGYSRELLLCGVLLLLLEVLLPLAVVRERLPLPALVLSVQLGNARKVFSEAPQEAMRPAST